MITPDQVCDFLAGKPIPEAVRKALQEATSPATDISYAEVNVNRANQILDQRKKVTEGVKELLWGRRKG